MQGNEKETEGKRLIINQSHPHRINMHREGNTYIRFQIVCLLVGVLTDKSLLLSPISILIDEKTSGIKCNQPLQTDPQWPWSPLAPLVPLGLPWFPLGPVLLNAQLWVGKKLQPMHSCDLTLAVLMSAQSTPRSNPDQLWVKKPINTLWRVWKRQIVAFFWTLCNCHFA